MKKSDMVKEINRLFAGETLGSPGTDAIRELVDKSFLSRWEPEKPEQAESLRSALRLRMKRSEMEKWLDGGLRYGISDNPEESIIKKFEELVEIPWEPEEPELPERLVLVWVTPSGNERVPYLVPALWSWRNNEDRDNGFRAARDAYNSENRYMRVVRKALAEARRPVTTFERILAILEERA